MFGFDGVALAGMTAAMFLGGLAKGITGGILPILALAISLLFVDAKAGLALVIVSLVLTNVWQARGNRDLLAPIRRFKLLLVVFCISAYVGAQLINVVDQHILFGVIGVATVIFTVSQVWRPHGVALSPRGERLLGPVVGLVGGVMGGLTTVWGPPFFMYLFALRLTKEEWVRTVNSLYLFGSVPLAIFYYLNGILDGDRLWLSCAACVPAMIGILIGERLRRFIDETLFRRILLFALFLIGLNMIRRAVF